MKYIKYFEGSTIDPNPYDAWKLLGPDEFNDWTEIHYEIGTDRELSNVTKLAKEIFGEDIIVKLSKYPSSFSRNDKFAKTIEIQKEGRGSIIQLKFYSDSWVVVRLTNNINWNEIYVCDDWWGLEILLKYQKYFFGIKIN